MSIAAIRYDKIHCGAEKRRKEKKMLPWPLHIEQKSRFKKYRRSRVPISAHDFFGLFFFKPGTVTVNTPEFLFIPLALTLHFVYVMTPSFHWGLER